MARPVSGARRDTDIAKVLTDEELLHNLSSFDGVIVADLYAHFCGPCEPMAGIFRRLKLDYQEQVHFIQAQTDHITFFQGWRNKSCPTFTVWVGGVLVDIIKGANSPLIERVIKDQVELYKITKERKPTIPDIDIPQFIRPGTAFNPDQAAQITLSSHPSGEVHQDEPFTVAIIKPDTLVPHVLEEMMQTLKLGRFEVIKQKRVWMPDETAREFYAEHNQKPFFNDLVDYMTSGPCVALLLSKEDAVAAFRELVGHPNPSKAQAAAPKTLRALYGKDRMHNAVHGSDSDPSAQREMQLLFSPQLQAMPTVPINTDVTMTVTFLGPEITADSQKVDAIIGRALMRGFEVHKRLELTVPREQVEHWLDAKRSQEDFGAHVEYWSSGPILSLVLKGEDVITLWQEMLGPSSPDEARKRLPRSLRAVYGTDDIRCGIEASQTQEQAHREYALIFPRPTSSIPTRPPELERTLGLIKPDAYPKADEIIEKIRARGFTIVERKDLQMTREQAQEFYRDHIEKPFYGELTEWMSSAPIVALVLEKNEAVTAWRLTLGPTNSERARESAPDSLRAQYGTDGTQNALHGSDSVENAAREITLMFDASFAMPSRVFSSSNLFAGNAPAQTEIPFAGDAGSAPVGAEPVASAEDQAKPEPPDDSQPTESAAAPADLQPPENASPHDGSQLPENAAAPPPTESVPVAADVAAAPPSGSRPASVTKAGGSRGDLAEPEKVDERAASASGGRAASAKLSGASTSQQALNRPAGSPPRSVRASQGGGLNRGTSGSPSARASRPQSSSPGRDGDGPKPPEGVKPASRPGSRASVRKSKVQLSQEPA